MSEPNEQNNLSEATQATSDQPRAPKKNLKFSYTEPVVGIVLAIVATVIFLGFPQIIAVFYIGGQVIPTFYTEVIRSLWIPIIIWALLRVGVETAYIIEHRYTKRLARNSVIGNVLAAICTFIIFISPRIVNADYIDWVHSYFANVSVWFGNILARPNLIILVIIMIVLILESVNVVRKGNIAEKKKDEEDEFEASQSEPEDEFEGKRFSLFEPVKGIIFAVVVTVIFLAFPQIIAFVFVNRLIPTFDAVVVQSLWIPIILWGLFRIGIEVGYFIERNYTKRLALITIIGNVLATICGFIIFISPRIVNGEYIDFIHTYFEDMAAWFSVPLTRVLDRPNLIILVVMIVVFIVESVNMVRRSRNIKEKEDIEGYQSTEVESDTLSSVTENISADVAEVKTDAEEV